MKNQKPKPQQPAQPVEYFQVEKNFNYLTGYRDKQFAAGQSGILPGKINSSR